MSGTIDLLYIMEIGIINYQINQTEYYNVGTYTSLDLGSIFMLKPKRPLRNYLTCSRELMSFFNSQNT